MEELSNNSFKLFHNSFKSCSLIFIIKITYDRFL